MSEKIFLHYTKEELDRNFDQRGWAKNALEVIDRCVIRSRAARVKFVHRANVPYGNGPDEVLDIFTTAKSAAPVQIFVHGGAWRNFTKDDYSFPAEIFVPSGVHTVVLNFANLPNVRLPEMVAQVRRGIEWVYRNAQSFGGDPRRIYLSAHSSGAHLSAMALINDWETRGLPMDLIKGATLVSGVYDLTPVVLSARGSYVVLRQDEMRELSPLLYASRVKCPVIVAYAEHDTDEFRRQSCEFAAALRQAGRLSLIIRLPGINHFESMEILSEPSGPLAPHMLAQMGLMTVSETSPKLQTNENHEADRQIV